MESCAHLQRLVRFEFQKLLKVQIDELGLGLWLGFGFGGMGDCTNSLTPTPPRSNVRAFTEQSTEGTEGYEMSKGAGRGEGKHTGGVA